MIKLIDGQELGEYRRENLGMAAGDLGLTRTDLRDLALYAFMEFGIYGAMSDAHEKGLPPEEYACMIHDCTRGSSIRYGVDVQVRALTDAYARWGRMAVGNTED